MFHQVTCYLNKIITQSKMPYSWHRSAIKEVPIWFAPKLIQQS